MQRSYPFSPTTNFQNILPIICAYFIYSVLHLIPILVARCGPVSELVPAHSDNGYIVVARFNSHCLLKMILVGLGLTEPLAKNS